MYELKNVTKSYDQSKRKVTALSDVTLSIPNGQMVAIQGPTGGGKSTLLQMLGALERPTAGSVMLGTAELSHLADSKLAGIRAKEIGFVFQGFNLIPTLRSTSARVRKTKSSSGRECFHASEMDAPSMPAPPVTSTRTIRLLPHQRNARPQARVP